MTLRLVHASAICFCLLMLSSIAAAQIPGQENALNGMRGVKVLIYTTTTELTKVNLTQDVLRTDIELRLRKAGIPILPGSEWPTGYQKAVVAASILSVKSEIDNVFAVSIRLQLWRDVGRQGSPVLIVTWEKVGVALFGKDVLERGIRDALNDDADAFANAYLAANPKP